MLQAGYVFCHRCGHATEDAYYYNSENNVWVQVKRTLTGKILVEHYTPEYMMGKLGAEEVDKIDRFTLSSNSATSVKDLQHTIEVDCYTDSAKITLKFNRSCPFCVGKQVGWESVKELIPGIGRLPLYIIGVIGARTVGKSCWIHALSCSENINKVNSQKDGGSGYLGYTLTTKTLSEENSFRPEATPINALGKTRIMNVSKKNGRTTTDVAQILVLDFAGEIFAIENQEIYNHSAANIFKGGVGYSGVDAVVFMMDPNKEDPRYTVADTYNRVNGELGLLNNRPVAFVMNKVDKMFSTPDTMYHINGDKRLPKICLLTEDTFAAQGRAMYQKRALLPRVALENALLKKFRPIVELASNQTRAAGFLIKATTPTESSDFLNFADSINVMDPLLWLLNELDIFPLDDRIN